MDQFSDVTTGQVVSGLKALGFCTVIEAALGADLVAYFEAKELVEKGFLTTSCCPAFVSYIKKNFPKLEQHISHNPFAHGYGCEGNQARTPGQQNRLYWTVRSQEG